MSSPCDSVLSNTDKTILTYLLSRQRATLADLTDFALPTVNRRTLAWTLLRLQRAGLIAAQPLFPEQGGRSPLVYHLLLSGARAIGQTSLGNQHYRKVRREFYTYQRIWQEVAFRTNQQGWTLCREESQCRRLLADYLLEVADGNIRAVPPLPDKISPDGILSTPAEEAIVIVAHPHSGMAFWVQRVHRYEQVLPAARLFGIALTSEHKEAALAAITHPQRLYRYYPNAAKRVALYTPGQLGLLIGQLQANR